MRWIASAHPSTKVDAKMCERGLWRLYAYPREPLPPPEGGFTLLDSGAFGLSMRGKAIDEAHMRSLAQYYQTHLSESVFGIAPDEFLNPQRTLRNFEAWHNKYTIKVVPVIQFSKKGVLDMASLEKQWRFYQEREALLPRWNGLPVVCLSNPGCQFEAYQGAGLALKFLRNRWQVWLHNLGAGWSSHDLRGYKQLNLFDSLDSIAYYTAAQAQTRWNVRSGDTRNCETTSTELALWNAEVATRIIN